MQRRAVLAVVLICSICVALFKAIKGVQVRDEDDVKFIQDLPDTNTQTFVAAAAAMDRCSEPIVNGKPKTEWPELVGKTADDAKVTLQKEAPGFQVQVLGANMMATMEWNCRRIRLWLDASGKVSRKPIVG